MRFSDFTSTSQWDTGIKQDKSAMVYIWVEERIVQESSKDFA